MLCCELRAQRQIVFSNGSHRRTSSPSRAGIAFVARWQYGVHRAASRRRRSSQRPKGQRLHGLCVTASVACGGSALHVSNRHVRVLMDVAAQCDEMWHGLCGARDSYGMQLGNERPRDDEFVPASVANEGLARSTAGGMQHHKTKKASRSECRERWQGPRTRQFTGRRGERPSEAAT